MINFDLASIDPEVFFKNPEEIVHCKDLTWDQKVELLHRWAYDSLELMVAEEENMQCKNPTYKLDDILRALHQLGAKINLEHPGVTKQGSI